MKRALLILSCTFALVSCTKPKTDGLGENCALMADATSAAKRVCFQNIEGLAVVEGDILLGTVEQQKAQTERLKNPDPHRAAVAIATGKIARWDNGVVPYTFEPNFPNTKRVTDAMAHITTKTGGIIRFENNPSASAFLRFEDSGNAAVCLSHVGKLVPSQQQSVRLASGCGVGETIHELGHALGLYHEQQREDRDEHIIINYDNIDPTYSYAFDRQIVFAQDIGNYDLGSIMHYGPFYFSINGRPTITDKNGGTAGIGQRVGLSAGDISAIKTLYGGQFLETPSWLPSSFTGSTGTALDPNRIRLSIQDNATDETETRLEYSKTPTGPWSTVTTPGTAINSVWEPTVTGLEPNTTYYFRAQAARGSSVVSAYTPVISIKTTDFPPSAPSMLTVTGSTYYSISLSWQANSNNAENYIVEFRSGANSSWQEISTPTSSTTYGLSASSSTTYQIRVRAQNSGGKSAPSNQVSATTNPPPPNAPDNLRVVNRTKNSISIAWDDRSSNEKYFQIVRNTGSGYLPEIATVPINVTQFENKDLPAGQNFLYGIRAIGDTGISDLSNLVYTSTLPEAPNAPTGVTLALTKTRNINVTWTDASSNEDSFQVQKAPAAAGPWTQIAGLSAGNTNSMIPDAFPLNSSQFFRVVASNGGGQSPSTPVEIKVSGPSAPVLDSVTVVSKTSITLNWTDTSNNETGFEIWRRVGNGAYARLASVGANITSYSAVSSPKTKYTFKIRAANILGASAYSAEKTATTPK